MKKNKANIFSLVFHFFFVFFLGMSPLGIPVAFAANTIMSVNPNSGSYTVGGPVRVDLIIDGHGDTFNAAQATTTLSNNLLLTDLTLGDCNFSFVETPTTSSPAFTGVLLGGSSQKCTVYTLTIMPISTGTGTVMLSNAKVKEYKTAQDILASLQNGNYSLNPSTNGATSISIAPTIVNNQQNPLQGTTTASYSLSIKAVDNDNTPLSAATVVLDPPQSAQTVQTGNTTAPALQTATTDQNGIAQFTNVSKGVHTVVVQQNNTQVAKTVLNVNGTNHTMSLGVKAQKQPRNLTLIIISTILVVGVFMFFLIRYTSLFKVLMVGKKSSKETPKTTE